MKTARFFRCDGFSLIEVVIATGLCTFALLTIFSLLPVGMVTIRNATEQVVETSIFNQLWSQFDATPFFNLQNGRGSVSPLFSSPGTALYFYYDQDGQELVTSGTSSGPPAGTIYIARCTLVNNQTSTSLPTTVPVVDGGVNPTGPALTFIQVQIGFHFDPGNVPPGGSDLRVAQRTFLIAKRDAWNGS